MFLPTTLRIPSITILLIAASVARAAIVQREQAKCTWPDTDTLFIIDSTLGISSYDHVLEIKFLEQILSRMRISSNQSRIALAQFTPQSRHEFSLASEGRDSAFAAVQRLQFVGCDSSVDRNGCQPTASVNSIASFSLREGNRKAVPDVIVVISSSKWPIPELRPKETLMSPISPIHSFYILVGANSAPQRRFEPAATSIMLTALDFSSLTQIVEPLCRSVNDFVFYGTPGNVPPPFNNTGGIYTRSPLYPVNVQTPRPDLHVPWDHFSPLAWTITALLILVFFIILLALGLAVWQYRDENNRLKRRLSEQEGKMRQQNEYFTGKIHKQMEAEIAARDKFEEELRKTEEKHIHHAERLERRLEKHLDAPREAPIPPPPPPPPPQPIIIPAFFGGANGNGTADALLEYARATGARVVMPHDGRQPQGIAVGEPHPSVPHPTPHPNPLIQPRLLPPLPPADPVHTTHPHEETPVMGPVSLPPSKRPSVVPSEASRPSRASSKKTIKSEPIPTHRNRLPPV